MTSENAGAVATSPNATAKAKYFIADPLLVHAAFVAAGPSLHPSDRAVNRQGMKEYSGGDRDRADDLDAQTEHHEREAKREAPGSGAAIAPDRDQQDTGGQQNDAKNSC